MERLYPNRKFEFNEEKKNWRTTAEKVLDKGFGVLDLIDQETGEHVEAEFLFLYSTLIYPGYNCRGIATIGNEIGTAFVELLQGKNQVLFRNEPSLRDKKAFDEMTVSIIEDLDDDCRNSEAIHVRPEAAMEDIVTYFHRTQVRNNNPDIPYPEHLFGVASVLESVANLCGEVDHQTLKAMKNAALGHDLLEDTAITESVMKKLYVGDTRTFLMIKELTNPNDDAHTGEYMLRLSKSSEETRLVKYADLIENTTSFCYSLHEPNIEDPVNRAIDFYLPILAKTTAVLAATEFKKYPETAKEMQRILKIYSELLISRIKLVEKIR